MLHPAADGVRDVASGTRDDKVYSDAPGQEIAGRIRVSVHGNERC
jgi:hypothetical protein